MSRLIRNKKLIGSTSNDSSHIIYDPSDTSRSETTVKSELDRLNAGVPAVDVGNAVTDWTNTETATSAAQGSDNYETLNAMTPSSTIKSLLGSIKSLLFGLSTQVTSMNTRLNDGTSRGEWVGTFSGQCLQNAKAYRKGNTVFIQGCLQFSGLTVNQYYQFGSGLPKPACGVMIASVPNEYGQTGTAIIAMEASGTISAKVSHANNYYYFTMAYPTHDAW
jgi:hypothetical protein